MSRRARRAAALLAVLLWVALGLAPTQAQDRPVETPVRPIALAGPITDPAAEISGLSWWQDQLVLLPENMNRYRNRARRGAVFVLREADLLAYLAAPHPAPLTPFEVPVQADQPLNAVPGFDGYEALAFGPDQRVYTLIEAFDPDGAGMVGYLVGGRVVGDLAAIELDLARRVALPGQTDYLNMAYESLIVDGERVIVLHEINGPRVNPAPRALVFDLDLAPLGALPMAPLDYRLTDVTAPDAAGRAWGINYFFPGEVFLHPSSEPLAERYGVGATHAQYAQVERLVALEIGADGITLADGPPVPFALEEAPRNWEGIARLGERGLLLVTDRFPDTRLGFVPLAAPLE